jgi:hypothetical protein
MHPAKGTSMDDTVRLHRTTLVIQRVNRETKQCIVGINQKSLTIPLQVFPQELRNQVLPGASFDAMVNPQAASMRYWLMHIKPTAVHSVRGTRSGLATR